MADRGGEFLGIHVRIDVTIEVSSSIKPMTTKLVKLVHLQQLIKLRLIKKVLVTSSHGKFETLYPHYQSVYGNKT